MKGRFAFDPAQCDHGAGSAALRQMLSRWVAVDWFEPPVNDAAYGHAAQLFEEHNARARAHLPELFPERLAIRPIRGSWADFAALCERVRAVDSTWDWKYGALKRLSSHHSRRYHLNLRDHARTFLETGVERRPGDLFFCVGEQVFWTGMTPTLDLDASLSREHADLARWYLSYAGMDVIEAVEWQLAEGHDDLGGNPFDPLLRCYGTGFYPFSLGPTEIVLLGFEG